jgi:hypothetical protein
MSQGHSFSEDLKAEYHGRNSDKVEIRSNSKEKVQLFILLVDETLLKEVKCYYRRGMFSLFLHTV